MIAAHRAAGRFFTADGVKSFVREEGSGPAIVLVHGVPTSSYLYRKMMRPLAAAGYRAIAFDFPGLGLADRPVEFDYTWGGLARWMEAALSELELDLFHLVVHDIGGPIGCEVAIRQPERVLSLTALNTLLAVAGFRRPWPMHPFSLRGIGEVYLRTLNRYTGTPAFYLEGIEDRSAVPRHEIYAYYELLKREDGGRAFLQIMRGFELTQEKQDFLWEGLARRSYPAQVVWGERDRALKKQRLPVQEALGVDEPLLLPAKHFLQEDQAPAVADAIARFAGSA